MHKTQTHGGMSAMYFKPKCIDPNVSDSFQNDGCSSVSEDEVQVMELLGSIEKGNLLKDIEVCQGK